jgi:excisionase family DNA binding protein
MEKDLMTVPEFLGRYSISRTAAYRETKNGRLRATKVGRRTYITRDDARAWLDALPELERRPA